VRILNPAYALNATGNFAQYMHKLPQCGAALTSTAASTLTSIFKALWIAVPIVTGCGSPHISVEKGKIKLSN
jgi:hypothetical protein